MIAAAIMLHLLIFFELQQMLETTCRKLCMINFQDFLDGSKYKYFMNEVNIKLS